MTAPVHVDHAFHFDRTGRTAVTGRDDHVRDLIEQLLFTAPGERVNRPEYGSGLLQLVFAPNSPELAAALQFAAQAALERWLGDVIELDDFAVEADEATLRVTIAYTVRRTGEARTAAFERRTG